MQYRFGIVASTIVGVALIAGTHASISVAAVPPGTAAIEFPNGSGTTSATPDSTVEATVFITTDTALGAYTLSITCDPSVIERLGAVRGGSSPQFSSAPIQTGSACNFLMTAFNASSLVDPVGKVSVAKFDVHVKPTALVGQSSVLNLTVTELTNTGALDIPVTDQDGRVNVCAEGACSGGISCPVAPMPACSLPMVPAKASLGLAKGATSDRDKAKWKWKTGTAALQDFGDPTNTDYLVCVWDEVGGTPTLVIDAVLPASATSWRAKSSGFSYKNKLSESGITKLKFKAGTDGKASISLSGAGTPLGFALPLAMEQDATVQLIRNDDHCWGAAYSTPRINDGRKFKARGE